MVLRRGPVPDPKAIRKNTTFALGEQKLSGRPGEGRPIPEHLDIKSDGARRFWDVWATSPQSEAWIETDWLELEVVTLLIDSVFQGDLRHSAELRQRTCRWGATVEDRARLRMSFGHDTGPAERRVEPDKASEEHMDDELYKLLSKP